MPQPASRAQVVAIWNHMIYTHVPNRGGRGVLSPADKL
jgi:hypothetical protein